MRLFFNIVTFDGRIIKYEVVKNYTRGFGDFSLFLKKKGKIFFFVLWQHPTTPHPLSYRGLFWWLPFGNTKKCFFNGRPLRGGGRQTPWTTKKTNVRTGNTLIWTLYKNHFVLCVFPRCVFFCLNFPSQFTPPRLHPTLKTLTYTDI